MDGEVARYAEGKLKVSREHPTGREWVCLFS